ncbi:MAG: hypothetical protein QOE06_3354 [Thermoleophilaceae bacterium]|nr:hypothetical protein [Thermoleophilaceae bacterium]
MTREELLALQERRARQALAAAARTPLWRELLGGADPATVPWESLPTTGRDLLSDRFADSVTDPALTLERVREHMRTRPGEPLDGYELFSSAGRTGRLAAFVYDRDAWDKYLGAVLRRFEPIGIARAQRVRVALVGTDDPAHTLPRTLTLFPRGAVFGLQGGLADCAEALGRFRPQALYGLSSAIAMLADEQLAGRLDIAPELVLAGTDALDGDARDRIRRAFGVEPHDSYASTEGGLIAAECAEHGGLHVNEDLVRLEPDHGGVLVTNLVNRVQPFVRYRVPDAVELDERPCACGAVSARLRLRGGRSNRPWRLAGPGGELVAVHPIVGRSALDALGAGPLSLRSDGGRLRVAVPSRMAGEARRRLGAAVARAGADEACVMVVPEDGA